jgi:hypothetical protein
MLQGTRTVEGALPHDGLDRALAENLVPLHTPVSAATNSSRGMDQQTLTLSSNSSALARRCAAPSAAPCRTSVRAPTDASATPAQ